MTSDKFPLMKAIFTLIFIALIYGLYAFIVTKLYPDLPDRGLFGDMFGGINALFAGLALAGVVVAIILQRQELNNQKREFEKQDKTSQIQRFELTFFNMLTLLSEIQNSLHYKKTELIAMSKGFNSSAMTETIQKISTEKSGREVFSFFREKLLQQLKSAPEADTAFKVEIQNFIFNKPVEANIQLGYYFKNVYTILKYIKIEECLTFLEKRKYSNILRAQLSYDELFLLMCNSAYNEDFFLFKLLLEKYSILKHFYLAIDDDKVRAKLEEDFQGRAFDKRGTFDVHCYDEKLQSKEIENYIQA